MADDDFVADAPSAGADDPRANQRFRTRKDLLLAAARLLRDGRRPSMAAIAAEAKASRATAYRYFDNLDALLCEAPVDDDAPSPEEVFASDPGAVGLAAADAETRAR